MMRIGSLFSGIGGLELGLEWAGVGRTVWQVERDPFCRAVLARHWPHATRYDDVRAVGAHNLEQVEVICGGYPCQDVSVAGAGAGLDGERSGLWFEFLRIVDECQPHAVIVENVDNGRARWLPVVRAGLCELGYSTDAVSIAAGDIGAPHERRRCFVVAVADPDRKPVHVEQQRHARRGDAIRHQGQAIDLDDGLGRDLTRASAWRAFPALCRVDDGVPAGVDGDRVRANVALPGERTRALGNAVVPQVAEAVGRLLLRRLDGPLAHV